MIVRTRLDPSWILVAVLTVFACAPLTYPGFFEAQSGFLPVLNVEHISDAPGWGQPADPVRGEGKLPYLLAWPFLQWSGSGVAAIKWGYALTFLLGALGVHAWTRRWLGIRGGVLAATVYTYLPWHLATVYVRGAYAEAWLWALWPAILWAIDRLNEGQARATFAGIAVGLPLLAATFWTQMGLAALAVPLLVAYGGWARLRSPWPLLRLAGLLALPLLLLGFAARWVPEANSEFAEHFLHPYQLLSAAWNGEGAYQLGVAAVGLSIVALALLLSARPRGKDEPDPQRSERDAVLPPSAFRRTAWFWAGALLVFLLLSLPLSSWLWRFAGFDAFLAHPWQLLALTGLPLAFLAGSVVRLDERLGPLPAWAGLAALVVLASYPYLAPRFTQIDPGAEPVALLQPVGAGAPQLLLLDYEIQPPTEVTSTLSLTLTWQAVEAVDQDYTVFVHALAEDNAIVAQRDSRPCGGECPTNTWSPGEIIFDRHELILDPVTEAASSPGQPIPVRLAVGLYLLETGDRATVAGRDDRTVFFDVP